MNPAELLQGLEVVEVGSGDAVAIAGRLFADAGAEVVKLVPPHGDASTPWAQALTAGKQLTGPGAEWDDAVRSARIVLAGDGDTPMTVDTLHTTYASVRTFDEVPGDDLLAQAEGGIVAGIGEPRRPPLKLPLDQSAHQGGLVLAIAAAATLFADEAARIDVSAVDVWKAFYTGPSVAMARFGRARTRRSGHRALRVPWPRTIVHCKDGYFAIQCATREHWQRFLDLTGRRDLEATPLFADRVKANDEHGDEAEAAFADWFDARTKAELEEAFLTARIPGAPVYAIDEVVRHPHLHEREAFRETGAANTLAVNLPFRLASGPGGTSRPRLKNAPEAPLAGLRVVDFGWVWAGAVPGHILADLGAEVIKVETMTHLDYMRQGRPIVGTARDPEQNPMFCAVNRDKLSLRIDMTKPDGAAILRDLIAKSDVVIENFTPGVLDRHGLGWTALSQAQPGLIVCSMSAAGATGPLRDIRTYATMIAGLCGLDSMVGYPGERVLGSQSSYADPNASLHATFAILAALYRRERTGAGCWIDLSQWQAGVWAMGEAVANWHATGAVPGPIGLIRPDRLVYGCFPAEGRDMWVAISVSTPAEWSALRAALGDPPALRECDPQADPALAEEHLAGETVKHTATALVGALRGSGIAAVVAGAQDISDGSLFVDLQHPVLDPVPVYRLPWRVQGAYLPLRKRAPLMGEDNQYVLDEILRVPPARVTELDAAGTFV